MTTTSIVDQYNNSKVWVIKHYSCGNYYANQLIAGRKLNRRFARMTRKQLIGIGLI